MMNPGILLGAGGCWTLPPADDGASDEDPVAPLLAPAGLTVEAHEGIDLKITLFDAWHWSLWHFGRLLIGDGHKLRIVDRARPGTPIAQVPIAVPPRFAWEQPEGPLADLVAPRLGLRAVVPMASVDVGQRAWLVRNGDQKIVVRLVEHVWGPGPRTLSLLSLRGYDDEAQMVRQALPKDGWTDRNPIAIALDAAGVQPRVWTNKPAFDYRDETPAHQAVVEMVGTMLALARETEAGIVSDIDTEFLHDYRVLLRKARSVLSMTKGVLAPEVTAALKDGLRKLAQRTNSLRDLDVHMMEHEGHVLRVPPRLRPGLAMLHDDLNARRDEAQQQVSAALQSPGYNKTMRALIKKIEQAEPGPKGQRPVRKVADRKLAQQLATILDQGRAITPATPDAAVHELRIECKKFRYLLEFFRALYPSDPVAATVKDLKGLQDVLGTFNDRSVQQDALLQWVERAPKLPKSTAVSVGALVAALADDQARVRGQVEARFGAFDEAQRRRSLWTPSRKRGAKAAVTAGGPEGAR